eukprot:m.214519 g.214519  ORF g.214519 m.214519 type:complete len:497 (-) comp33176_c6_seq16:285-1775(-)
MGASQGKLEDHQIDSRVFSAFQAFKLQTKSGPPQLPRKQIEAVLDSLLPHGEIFSKACCTVWLKTDQEFVSLRGYAEFVALALGHGFEYTPGAQDTQPQPISLQRFYCDVFNSTSTLTKTAATRQLLETLKSLTGWDDPKSADASSSSPSTSSPSTSLQSTCPRIFDKIAENDLNESTCEVLEKSLPRIWGFFSSKLESVLLEDVTSDNNDAKPSESDADHVHKSGFTFFNRYRAIHSDQKLWRNRFQYPCLVSEDEGISTDVSILAECKERWLLPLSMGEKFCESGSWSLLYSSRHHGHGTNRLQHHVFKYAGPTLLVVEDTERRKFVCTVDKEWEESNVVWGGDACRCFFFDTGFTRYDSDTQMYYQTRGRSNPHGLGIYSGGKRRIWVESDLKNGVRTIGPGSTPGIETPFVVLRLEVWGCGGLDAVNAQRQRRAVTQKVAEQASKAKRLDWGVDRSMLMMAGTNAGRHMADARIDVADETQTTTTTGKRVVY